ncbi:MAG: hypothetical protein GXY53_05645 [Desulfobulbus sp.]|nr:hypothetical protein [Desulfobulbus sp.]
MTHLARFVVLLAAALFLSACAGGLSQKARSQVNYSGSFRALQQQPYLYTDKVVMLGGKIISTEVSTADTRLLVLHVSLDNNGRPRDELSSEGRFIIRTDQFVDPAIYPPGTLISAAGRVVGSERRTIGQMDYEYPVIQLIEIKKWPPPGSSEPSFHFGIGVGTYF